MGSNPFLTGGKGFSFENHVQALTLIDLVCGSYTRVFRSCRVQSVEFQTNRLGYETDDMLVCGVDSSIGRNRRLLYQIKHGIRFTKSDSKWTQSIGDFWKDYSNTALFDYQSDAFVVAVTQLSKDDAHFAHTLELRRQGNVQTYTKGDRERLKNIRNVVCAVKGRAVSDDEFEKFVACIHVVLYGELDTWESLSHDNRIRDDPDFWNEALEFANRADSNGASLTLLNLPTSLIQKARRYVCSNSIMAIGDHSHRLMERIKDTIAGRHVGRKTKERELGEALDGGNIVFVVGDAGTGKSVLVKDYLQEKVDAAVVWLTGDDLRYESLEKAALSLGISENLRAVANQLSLNRRVIVVLDSMERTLQSDNVTCISDLIEACYMRDWCFIGILRSYSSSLLPYRLDITSKSVSYVTLGVFSVEELSTLDFGGFDLVNLSSKNRDNAFYRNPYVLSMLSKALATDGNAIDLTTDPTVLRKTLWDLVVERINECSQRHARERGEAFEKICVQRASNLTYAVDCNEYDSAIVDDLCITDLLKHVNDSNYVVSHDALEDWGVFHYFDRWYSSQDPGNTDSAFLSCIRDRPGLSRAFTTWLGEMITFNGTCLTFVRSVVSDPSSARAVKSFCIAAVIESGQLATFLDSFEYALFGEDYSVFAQVVSTLRLCAVEAKPAFGLDEEISQNPRAPIRFVSRGMAWQETFSFALRNVAMLDLKSCRECANALREWSVENAREADDEKGMYAAGCLALRLLEMGYGDESFSWAKPTLSSVATGCYPAIRDEYHKFLQLDKTHRDVSEAVRELRRDAVFGLGSYSLAVDDPEFLAGLVKLEFLEDVSSRRRTAIPYDYGDPFYSPFLGLSSDAQDHCMAHGRRPPFFGLFRCSPMLATKLCVEICNHIGSAYALVPSAESDVVEVSIRKGAELEDGQCKVLLSGNMWCAYRGMGNMPPHVQAMLMSLENCLIGLAEADSHEQHALLLRMYDYVLLEGKTALTLGVAASIAMGFSSIIGDHCLPLFSAPELFIADSFRANQEGFAVQPWSFAFEDRTMYECDRIPSNNRDWRNTTLEQLCVNLQLRTEYRDSILSMIKGFPEDDPWLRALKARLDLTGFEVSPSKEKGVLLLTPPGVNLGEEIESEHRNYSNSLKLCAWSQKVLNGTEGAEDLLNESYLLARDLERTNGEDESRSINIFCAAVVRAGLLDSGPIEMHEWCCKRILDVCDNALRAEANAARVDITLSFLDNCLEVVPRLTCDTSERVRRRARQCVSGAFMSKSKSIAVPVAKGIAAYLWDVDCCFARELMDARAHASQMIDKAASEVGVRYESTTRTVLLTACLSSHNTCVHDDVADVLNDAIEAEKYERDYGRIRYLSNIDVANDVGRDGPADLIGKHFFGLGSVEEYAPLLKKAAKDAPTLTHSILTYLAGYCAEVGNNALRWTFVGTIENELVEVALSSPNDLTSPWASLIIRALYGDADWQPLDYEQQTVRYGKREVMEISSKAGTNIAVFQSLARLMYHFPEVFSTECMDILNDVDDERMEELFARTIDAMFCIVAWLRVFVLRKKDSKLSRGQYDCCLRVLDLAIESGSREAHFVRQTFINKRWEFTRGW